MKDTFYFSHDYNARSDIKIKRLISKHGMAGYGIFWALVEDLYNNANALPTDYESIAFDLRTDCELIKSIVVDFDLFVIDGATFGSSSVERRLNERDSKSKKASESARKRWENMRTHSESNANAMPTQSEGNAIKERKGKEKKESKVDDSSGKPDSLTFDFLELYNKFLEEKIGTTEQFSVAGRAGLSKTIRYLREQVEKKHKGADVETIANETINAWRWILSNFDRWDKFHQNQLKLEQINSNLINIITTIKNGTSKTPKRPSARDLAAEAFAISQQRNQSAEDSNTSQG